jgi:hypothetical protein
MTAAIAANIANGEPATLGHCARYRYGTKAPGQKRTRRRAERPRQKRWQAPTFCSKIPKLTL